MKYDINIIRSLKEKLYNIVMQTPEELHKDIQQSVKNNQLNINKANQIEKEILALQNIVELEIAEFEKQNVKYLQ